MNFLDPPDQRRERNFARKIHSAMLRRQSLSLRTAMAEIVNLRRARKAKKREDAAARAEANRVKHGVAKSVRDLAKTRREKDERAADAHKLEEE